MKNIAPKKLQAHKMSAGTRLVMGKNSITELLRWNKDKIIKLYCAKKALLNELQLDSRHTEFVEFDYISKISNSDNHQGVAALIKDNSDSISFKQHLKNLEAKESAIILALATVQDPHHLGAAFRAAEVFSADLLIFSDTNSTNLTAAVSKVAVGAAELVPYCQVANINEAIRKAKESNFWVVAAEPETSTKAFSIDQFDFPKRSLIVFGAEGQGLPKLTKELSDYHVYIKQKGKIDSLSLSQAISIFLYEATN